MKMELKIISKEFIKPSSPTPNHLRHVYFSFLDQLQPNIFIPLVHFYPKSSNISNLERCNQLKKSLSTVLTIFYPLAGRVNNDSYVDCNDEGILFVEAKVNCQLSDVLRERNPSNNNYFIPPQLDGGLTAFSQITVFNCGGVAISFSIFHKLGDALSMITFLRTWAATARGNTNTDTISIPPFGSASLFPPMEVPPLSSDTDVVFANEKLITKVFVFDSYSIANIRAKYTANSERRMSRVEALVGFICSRFMAATRNKNKKYRVVQAVNLRTRMDPPLPMLSFGNYVVAETVIEGKVEAEGDGWLEAVKKIADSTKNVNADYIKKFQNKDEQLNCFKRIYEFFNEKEAISFSFSSVQNFPVYEIDYGWGKPLWFGTTSMPVKNLFLLAPTKDGLGIELWISLKEEDMAKLELDNQLLQYVSAQTLKLDAHSLL